MGSQETTRLNESLYELYRPQGIVPRMQVVFFHGFQPGSYENAHLSTWLSEDGSCIWPKTWLEEEFPDAHILSVSYNGMLNQKRGKLDLFIVVENLISDLLMANVGQERRCPVVLVGHSFGGLVMKQLLVHACHQTGKFKRELQTTLELDTFLYNVKGLFFYATPHLGTPVVDPELLMEASTLMEYVKTLSNLMSRLNDEFDHLTVDKWRMVGLGESLPSKWGSFHGVVVPEASSRKDAENFNIVAADHISISRPSSKTDRRFYALTELLKRIAIDSQNNERPENWQHLPESVTGMKRVVEEIIGKRKSRLGFVGMGGIGKSTLAKAVFNELEYQYDFTCFLTNVKEIKGTIEDIKDAILAKLHYKGKKGAGLSLSKMTGEKLLLVLDDVSSPRDLDIVAILMRDFGIHKESRFIATSRNKELFQSYRFVVHPLLFLSTRNATDLFLSYAPNGRHETLQIYVPGIVDKCGGLPLALQVVGNYLNTKSQELIWKRIVPLLDKAKDVADFGKNLWAILKLSYDDLPNEEKDMFLDATTVFYKSELRTAKAAWNITMEGDEEISWQHLVDLSLVWEIRNGKRIEIGMHEHLLNLGRNISCTPRENDRRIWIWNDNMKAIKILSANKYRVDDMKDIVAMKCCTRDLDSQNTYNSAGLACAPENYVTVLGRRLCEMDELRYLWLEGLDIDDQIHNSAVQRQVLPLLPQKRRRSSLPSTLVYLYLSNMNFSDTLSTLATTRAWPFSV